jgi:hypothetical protein
LEPDLRLVALPQGVVCYDAASPIDQVYFPHTGMISLIVTMGDGQVVDHLDRSRGCTWPAMRLWSAAVVRTRDRASFP